MGRIIKITGHPYSGKTILTLLFGRMLSENRNCNVLVFLPDLKTPSLDMIFPERKKADLPSFGSLASYPEMNPSALAGVLCQDKKRNNLGYIGYRAGENEKSYAAFTEEKAGKIMGLLKEMPDVLLIDVPDFRKENAVETVLRKTAGTVLRLKTATLPGILYDRSNENEFEKPDFTVMNRPKPFLPEGRELGKTDAEIPFDEEIFRYSLTGGIPDLPESRKTRAALEKILAGVTDDGSN